MFKMYNIFNLCEKQVLQIGGFLKREKVIKADELIQSKFI